MASYATSSPCSRRWSGKRYLLAALAGILVLTVVVILASVVLSPAEIRFSITGMTSIHSRAASSRVLNLTLTADNTSHRAGAKYRSVLVYVGYTPSSSMRETSLQVGQVSSPSWQPPGSTRGINVSASLPDSLLEDDFAGSGENATRIGVLLDAVVLFKYGSVYTRPYNIRVLCDPVDYFNRRRSPRLPIICNDG